jgi:hypothetical protein
LTAKITEVKCFIVQTPDGTFESTSKSICRTFWILNHVLKAFFFSFDVMLCSMRLTLGVEHIKLSCECERRFVGASTFVPATSVGKKFRYEQIL